MASMNKAIIMGNLGQDPETRMFPDGGRIVTLSVATSETWRDKQTGERREKTQWHRVVIKNDGLAKVAEQYLAKGDAVMVVGQIEQRAWEDQSGQKRYSTEVVLQGYRAEMQIIRCRKFNQRSGGNAGDHAGSGSPQTSGNLQQDLDDDIPF